MKICPECGMIIPESVIICWYCGHNTSDYLRETLKTSKALGKIRRSKKK